MPFIADTNQKKSRFTADVVEKPVVDDISDLAYDEDFTPPPKRADTRSKIN